MTPLHFFNPYSELRQTENRLPHWEQNGAIYFVTFRLADSIPAKLRSDWSYERETWLKLNPQPWSIEVELEYHQRFAGKIEEWSDAGYGSCILRRPDCGRIVDETLRHFDGNRIGLISSVVMPNHVHVLFVQNPEFSVEKVLRSWKSYPARQINALIDSSTPLWEKDYFDRLIRDEKHLANCVRYIRRNPAKAKLRSGEYILHENEIAKEIAS
jgi:putative transposase